MTTTAPDRQPYGHRGDAMTTRKLTTVALATIVLAILPTITHTITNPTPAQPTPATQPTYPAWMYEAPYPEPDWAVMERCWSGRANSPSATEPGCADETPLSLPCHWTVGYPNREWVTEACGDPASWAPDFGFGWYGHWDPHPGRDWVAHVRAGGQP